MITIMKYSKTPVVAVIYAVLSCRCDINAMALYSTVIKTAIDAVQMRLGDPTHGSL